MLCQYKNIFGKPNTGIHSIRLFNIAFIDLFMTVLAAYIISIYLHTSFFYVLLILLLIAIIAHKLFCVETTINKIIFG